MHRCDFCFKLLRVCRDHLLAGFHTPVDLVSHFTSYGFQPLIVSMSF
jgi:hypothetical protein